MLKNCFTLLSVIVLVSSLCISCMSLKSHLRYTNSSSRRPPIKAFTFVAVQHVAEPVECLPSPQFEACKQVLPQMGALTSTSSGSGLLVWAKSTPVILTAAHVCTKSSEPTVYEHKGVKIKIKHWEKIMTRNFTGEFQKSKILHIDSSKDLCALSVSKLSTAPVRVSHKKPKPGDRVYAISAPFGINTPTMNLVFSGHYSGYDSRWNYYSIPTRPGSSGSVVLDRNYRAVGMLNAAFLDIEHIGIGAGYDDIKNFLLEISSQKKN